MPFDGFFALCMAGELNALLSGGKVEKVSQPERDGIILTVRAGGASHRLLASANPSAPRIHLTGIPKESPGAAPNFCMLLRKYLVGGRVISVTASDMERVVEIGVRTWSQLGDPTIKRLVVEIMGKHSNIILINEEGFIHDAIKHVDPSMSSVREVMPARRYAPPPTQGKAHPDRASEALGDWPETPVKGLLVDRLMGFSPFLAGEVCFLAGVGPDVAASALCEGERSALLGRIREVCAEASSNGAKGYVLYARPKPKPTGTDAGGDATKDAGGDATKDAGGDATKDPDNSGGLGPGGFGLDVADFHFMNFPKESAAACGCAEIAAPTRVAGFGTLSETVEAYYAGKKVGSLLEQVRGELVKLAGRNAARCKKKADSHEEKIKETDGMDSLRVRGDLIMANLHSIG
ncbi:MAG: NFACT family protein, partial [Oscillospiraceae bacterium]|nr:NFACT family protein [Oscillospiraceae bacterium]